METELTDRIGPVLAPPNYFSGFATLPVPLPCNGKAPHAITQWKKRPSRHRPHRQFVHSAPPELGVQLTKE